MRESPWTPTERIAGRIAKLCHSVVVEAGPADLLEQHGVGVAQDVEPLARHLADDADREPRPRERLAPHHPLGQAELLADAAHLVLEDQPQRLDELEVHVLGQAADVVVAS